MVWLNWNDGKTEEDQGSLDFTITVTAVDIDGNRGPASGPIPIRDPGRASGCALRRTMATSDVTAPALLLCALVLGYRRRKRKG